DVLLDACAALRHRRPVRLYLVGDGPLRGRLEKAAGALGLADVVSFVGPRSHDELPDWYRAADLTVLPSRSEGLPNVLRESLACGTPFVASRVGGVPEVAEGAGCRLVPPGDAAALGDAIAEALVRGGVAMNRPQVRDWAEAAHALFNLIRVTV